VTVKSRSRPIWLNLAVIVLLVGLGVLIVRQAAIAVQPAAPHRFRSADLLDEAALAGLGFEADRRGDRARARILLDLAGRLSWRDAPVQAWLLQRAAESGDWTAVMVHADALLRTDADGALRPQLFRLLDVMASDETSRAALLGRLRRAPWWREAWLAHLAAVAASPAGAVSPDQARAILMSLASGPRPLTRAEYLPYVEMRLARGDYAQAERDWAALARRADGAALLRDPTFQASSVSGPFGWTPASGVGASSEMEAPTDAARALRVDYDGYSPSRLPGQLLVLPPGRYSFAWRERIVGPPRLAWRVRCLGRTPQVLIGAPPLAGPGWRARRLTFDIAADCPAQQVELAPLPGERRDEVTGWFADLSLSRRS
jgi:hypothetical protein